MVWLWEHFIWPFHHVGAGLDLVKLIFVSIATLPPPVLIGGFLGSLIGAQVGRHDDESWGEATVMHFTGAYLGAVMGGFLVYFVALVWPF